MSEWRQSACILCESNCGIEVRLGGENGRRFERIRGDKAHPSSRGYTCEKALRLDYYQNGRDRVTAPLRRRSDGSFEEIDWDTAIAEVANRLADVRQRHGGDKIFYFGGGGQGNHIPGVYAASTRRALGIRYRSNALAQEKTGEIWVNSLMLGTYVRGDFDHAEVAVFAGKNPWQSHGFARARVVLKEIATDPDRTLIVIDPRRTETAELADIHLQLRPGTDAWLLAALTGTLVQDELIDHDFIAGHTSGADEVLPHLRRIPVDEYCAVAGVAAATVRQVAERIGAAASVSFYEDLGMQMNRHSTLASYLEKLAWTLTGNFARPGTANAPSALIPLTSTSPPKGGTSPVAGARIISDLVPCNVIAEEILTDHPDRYRAMIVESANPAHSLADSPRMTAALDALELVVVIDVALTETARHADYVLPTPTQYEKWEATLFNFEFPANVFHLRRPLLTPPPGVLPEPEIHARLCEALGAVTEADLAPLRDAAMAGRLQLGQALLQATAADPRLAGLAAVVLYRTLGPALGDAAAAAPFWGAAHRLAMRQPESLRRAGYDGEGPQAAEQLFEAILTSPSGTVFSVDDHGTSWERVRTPDGRIQLAIPELLEALKGLGEDATAPDQDFPLVLTAGERRSFTANTIFRNPDWRKKDREGSLRVSPADAAALGLSEGQPARLTTARGSAEVTVAVSDIMQPGHISLPNGLGVDYPDPDGERTATGVAPNMLTSADHRDPFAGTPWHKHVPARLEPLPA